MTIKQHVPKKIEDESSDRHKFWRRVMPFKIVRKSRYHVMLQCPRCGGYWMANQWLSVCKEQNTVTIDGYCQEWMCAQCHHTFDLFDFVPPNEKARWDRTMARIECMDRLVVSVLRVLYRLWYRVRGDKVVGRNG